MYKTRPPAVAGTFYPENPDQLSDVVDQYLNDARIEAKVPKAIVVPHAGFIFSGPVAASAFARLMPAKDTLSRVVLIGPSHRVGFRGLAVSSAEHFSTPLGNIPLDTKAIKELIELPFVNYQDQAHQFEHCLEVQLPFLQKVLRSFTVIPIIAGDAKVVEVSQVLAQFWGGAETMIVISSDLSHYHDYQTAQHLDKITSEKIEKLLFEQLDFHSACGQIPLSGLLALARKKSFIIQTIDLRNSGDTAGDKEQVVGYGSYVIE